MDFAQNLVRAMAPMLEARLTVVRPDGHPGRVGQMLMRYLGEVKLELRFWRRCAVALFPNYFIFPLAFTKLRRVVVVHDLQFKHYPQYTHPVKRFVLEMSYRCARRYADGVVFISGATRDDFLQLYGSPKRHVVIYNPIAIEPPPYMPSTRPYPYVVANFHYYPHKNLGGLVAYYKALRTAWPELRLVLTGHKPPDLDAIVGGDPAAAGIEHVGFVSKDEVIALVQGAAFFMSLSQFEGFNMSAAEAALLGKPLVLSDIPVHREVFGGVALFVDPAAVSIPVQQVLSHVRSGMVAARRWQYADRVAPTATACEYLAFMNSVYAD
jgi:glycosyltransferase involved in cell wall biosynthesis